MSEQAQRPRFHLAFAVNDLAQAERFYVDVLGCQVGRQSDRWIDFDFHGHQIVAHLSDHDGQDRRSEVDGHAVPVFHFGLILPWSDFWPLAEKFRQAELQFLVEPYTRFAGLAGEQLTMFIRDPSGNALEFKAFADDDQLFATD